MIEEEWMILDDIGINILNKIWLSANVNYEQIKDIHRENVTNVK